MVFVHSLSEEEIKKLKQFLKTAKEARIYRRALIIWLSHLGKSVPEIEDIVNMDRHTIVSWINKYEEKGLKGLEEKPRSGRPKKANQNYIKKLLEDVRKSPELFGYKQVNWTTELLKEHLAKLTEIQLSCERIRQILQEHGISFHRPKSHVTSPDPEYDLKKRKC